MPKQTIVEINGRKYDADSGQLITNTPMVTGKSIDGYQAPVVSDFAPRTINKANAIHEKPQKTKKLHPAAANRGPITPKKVVAKSSPAEIQAQEDEVKSELNQRYESAVNREHRATKHQKSKKISKFTDLAGAQPKQVAEEPIAPAVPYTMPQKKKLDVPQQDIASPAQVVEADKPKKEKQKRGLKPKFVPASLAILVALGITGYIAYQNIPNIALRIASSRAGLSASLPGYKPAGFSFSGPVAYSEGVIELQYESNSDDRAFKLVQKESAWDSQSLLDNYVEPTSADYLTFQERGLTVYVFNNSSATWVDGGVWYTVEGDSLLTSEQLLKMAGSL